MTRLSIVFASNVTGEMSAIPIWLFELSQRALSLTHICYLLKFGLRAARGRFCWLDCFLAPLLAKLAAFDMFLEVTGAIGLDLNECKFNVGID